MKTIKQLEKEHENLRGTLKGVGILFQIQTLNEVLKLIDEIDDEHLIHFRNKMSKFYIAGWVESLERLKDLIEGKQEQK